MESPARTLIVWRTGQGWALAAQLGFEQVHGLGGLLLAGGELGQYAGQGLGGAV
jgi:hypothetical protein